ncbi:hypothetical protein NBRC10512_007749 [Rhodotorula toruloides]
MPSLGAVPASSSTDDLINAGSAIPLVQLPHRSSDSPHSSHDWPTEGAHDSAGRRHDERGKGLYGGRVNDGLDTGDEAKGRTSEEEEDDGEARGLLDDAEALFGKEDDGEADSAAAIVVPETDDPSLPTLTPRVWILGTLLCVFGAAVSQLFFFKSNAPSFSSFFIILIAHPLGKWMDRLLPDTLRRGTWNKKEHMLVGILAGSGASAAYAGEIISVQDLYYHSDLGNFGGLLLLLSTQLIGFGLSGLTYRFLVRPTQMLWPSQLVTITLYETLHGGKKDQRSSDSSQMQFFRRAFLAIFSWQFLPSVIFPGLSSIAILCILNNRSWIMRTLGSGYNGFGWFVGSLDWSVVGQVGPLYTPWFAQCSYLAGTAFNIWIVAPLLYFSNWWNAQDYDSPLAAHLYNATAGRLNVHEILNADLSLNEARYAEVGPLRLTPYFALTYGVSFAVLTSVLTSVALWHWDDIRAALSSRTGDSTDVHVEIVERNYLPVPSLHYVVIFGLNLLAAIVLLAFYPQLQLPTWGLLLSLSLALVCLVPIGIISAITNTTIGLNVLTEFVAGFIWPGKPIANICFKVYGYMCLLQSLDLTSDMKLGLYMHVPPRDLFVCQCYGTAVGSVINFLLIRGVIAAKRPYLDGSIADPTQQWDGRKPEIFFSASVIWGLIGPKRFFSGQYHVLYWGFLLGALLPLVPWYIYRRTGKPFWKKISVPLVLHGAIAPPQTPMNVLIPGFFVSFLSQFWALRYHTRWFEKYAYVLSSALDAGTSVQAIVIYILGISSFWEWWGNSSIDVEHCVPGPVRAIASAS